MERQLERRREPEPTTFDREIENLWQGIKDEKEKAESLPRVLKFDSIPWTQGAQAFHKYYIGPGLSWRLRQFPLFSMAVVEQIIPPGGKSGRHRHFMEAIFYIMEGEGYEIHDETKYPWQAGDVMMVPTYCVHQHFAGVGETPARLFFAIPTVFDLLGIASIEQIELHPNYQIPEGAQPIYGTSKEMLGYKMPDGKEILFGFDSEFQKRMDAREEVRFSSQAKTTYDTFLNTLDEQMNWRHNVPHVISGRDRPWEDTAMGRIKYLVHSTIPSALLLYDCFIQEIPPGGSSGKHRHVSEEVHKILDGSGYDIQDGVRWDWEKEDVVAIPTNVVHQHFNTDPRRPALFLSYQMRLHHYLGHGGYEHLEDAPE
ncbi:MAG: cupin domain-containing protein, partial [Dehalococcoidia bacterium]